MLSSIGDLPMINSVKNFFSDASRDAVEVPFLAFLGLLISSTAAVPVSIGNIMEILSRAVMMDAPKDAANVTFYVEGKEFTCIANVPNGEAFSLNCTSHQDSSPSPR